MTMNVSSRHSQKLLTLWAEATTRPDRITSELKQRAEQLDWSGVSFPTPIDGPNISTFSANNDVSDMIIGLTR